MLLTHEVTRQSPNLRYALLHVGRPIYSRASTVRVWIDCYIPPNDKALQNLQNLSECSDSECLGDNPHIWESLIPLLQNPYWERLWVQQELIFALRLEFHCQSIVILGDNLMAFQLQMDRKRKAEEDLHDTNNLWVQLAESLAIGKTPSRRLLWWRTMMLHHLPADKYTLRTDDNLYLPLSSVGMDPRTYGSALTTPIYLLGALRNAQLLKVTDPRDRVIASLNLAIDFEDDSVRDYSMSAADIYTNIARVLPFKCNSLQFLPQVKVLREPDWIVKGLPSWVPNWNAPPSADYFWHPFRASGDLPMYPHPFPFDLNTFTAQGFCYDIVNRTIPYSITSTQATTPLSAIRELILSLDGITLDTPSALDLVARTLTEPPAQEQNSDDAQFTTKENILYTSIILRYGAILPTLTIRNFALHPKKSYEEFCTTIAKLDRLRHHDQSPIGQLDLPVLLASLPERTDSHKRFNHFVHLIHQTLSSGSLISTVAGRSAIVETTAAVATEDSIWILFGCPTPMLLRNKGGYCTVVSPAYVPGIMYGEAVEGVQLAPERDFYVSGKGRWTIQNVQLR
jgi:hypothetical protein